ncbi:MAG: hypothetical protein U9Q66_03180 [Patescibacteria group bacterium]|nr:hypothetical protein [Patescibacteria group bacterium]
MTIKESILKSLEDLNDPSNYKTVYNHIIEKNYYVFTKGKTPERTVSAQLGDFVKKGDSRVKRTKNETNGYLYYLTKNEDSLIVNEVYTTPKPTQIKNKKEKYLERDLHSLISSYLKSKKIFSKTILHEKSNGNDSHQKWIHPDIIGIKFLNLPNKISNDLMKVVNKTDTFKITSYEVKREINTDYELKKCYFQAVSNSSWSNYGYLISYEIDSSLMEEMERLNQSFGIGIIELGYNPYESKILFPSTYRELDFKTIDKLCKINKDFELFIELTEKILTTTDKYYKQTEKELIDFCDSFFENDTDIENYCQSKNIPPKDSE